MKISVLKKIRLVLAIFFFTLLIFSFIDFRYILPEAWLNSILYLQFVPSLLKFTHSPSFIATGFIVVTAITVLMGRTYCSVFCPLGIYQDIVARVAGKIARRNLRYSYKKPSTIIRYSLLALTIIMLLAGSMFFVELLDPYSIFGRLATYFFQPIILVINNILAWFGSKVDFYGIFRVEFIRIPLIVYIIPGIFLVLITYMSFSGGRSYCNTVCPLGTLLGLLSKVSVLRINIDKTMCTHCGRCAVNCKASCIDFINDEVDVSRCVNCFNCLTVCNDNAIRYNVAGLRKHSSGDDSSVDTDKRKFIAGSFMAAISARGILSAQETKTPLPTKASTIKENRTYPLCPYGGISLEHFTSYCTACSLCVSACPEQIIIPSFKEYGLAGIMQPRMDYTRGFCNFDCTRCTEVCPSGALMPLTVEAKKLTQIGKVTFIRENCIVVTERTDCGACSEHCPTKAVHMVPFEDNLVIPEVNNLLCVGCGACEFACPTKPFKAIFVDGNAVHQDAQKPIEEKLKVDDLEEFPF